MSCRWMIPGSRFGVSISMLIELKFPLQFKYVIYHSESKHIVVWEQGSNRMIRDFVCKEPRSLKIHTDENFRFPATHWRGAGVAVPVFSLRTEKSGGIGEFPDIKKLVDWAKLTGSKADPVASAERNRGHAHVDRYLSL